MNQSDLVPGRLSPQTNVSLSIKWPVCPRHVDRMSLLNAQAYCNSLVTSRSTLLVWASAEMPVCMRISYFLCNTLLHE